MKVAAEPLLQRFGATRAATRALAGPLSAEDCTVQSMDDASPVKWHLAHTTWFFETFLLARFVPRYRPFHAEYRELFNSYYDAVGPRYPRPQRGLLTRPSLDEVIAYRSHVDERVEEWLNGRDEAEEGALTVLETGLNHEEQHQELLLMDVKHLLAQNPLAPAYHARELERGSAPTLSWREFGGGVVPIGHPRDPHGDRFAFDNESPAHEVLVGSFALATRLATNAEYAAFLDDGGYARPELWLSDGFAFARANNWQAPIYWRRDGNAWRELTLSGALPLAPERPVCHLSYYEADAFARWSAARLPTEFEWEHAARDTPLDGHFADRGIFHPSPAASAGENGRPSRRAASLAQLYGDVWEWTASAYAPYPGFRAPDGALGEYNGKFMVNQMVLRGGSCATPAGHVRATYRNFFHPHTRWHFSGVRLARDAG